MEKKLDLILDKLDKLEKGQDKLEKGQSEHTQLLNAVIHATEVNKAQIDSISMDLAKLTGEVVGLRRDLTTIEVVTASNYADLVRIKAVK